MKGHTFVHDHYSPEVGESPIGHAAAVLGGLVTMAIGLGLVLTVALLPVGLVVATVLTLLFLPALYVAWYRSLQAERSHGDDRESCGRGDRHDVHPGHRDVRRGFRRDGPGAPVRMDQKRGLSR